jgi:hypothetical protein
MITREQIVARLAMLKANLNAQQGAIQDCEYWLGEWDKENAIAEAKKLEPDA